MQKSRLGCLSPSAIVATLVSLLMMAGFISVSGSGFFTAGSLNAKAGKMIGGVISHAEIGNDCAKCHPAPWDADTLGDRCMVCHKNISTQLSDPTSLHFKLTKNQFMGCRACHSEHRGPEAGLTKTQSEDFPHDGTGYSLKSHMRRSDGQTFVCADCHGADIAKFDPAVCSTCHQQIDKEFLTTHIQAYGTDCRGCHDGIETISKKFDHNLSAFKLEDKHAGLECAKCHANARTAVDFKTTSNQCSACHIKDDTHAGKFGNDCGACHKPSGWKPATFDHNLASFKLDGAHLAVTCQKCHVNNVFKGIPPECSGCHKDPSFHQGLFSGQTCSTCHQTLSWLPAKFNQPHPEPRGGEGGSGVNHGGATCRDCHTVNLMTATCIKCHDSNNPDNGD